MSDAEVCLLLDHRTLSGRCGTTIVNEPTRRHHEVRQPHVKGRRHFISAKGNPGAHIFEFDHAVSAQHDDGPAMISAKAQNKETTSERDTQGPWNGDLLLDRNVEPGRHLGGFSVYGELTVQECMKLYKPLPGVRALVGYGLHKRRLEALALPV